MCFKLKKVLRKPAIFDSYFFSLFSSTFPHLPRTAKFGSGAEFISGARDFIVKSLNLMAVNMI